MCCLNVCRIIAVYFRFGKTYKNIQFVKFNDIDGQLTPKKKSFSDYLQENSFNSDLEL